VKVKLDKTCHKVRVLLYELSRFLYKKVDKLCHNFLRFCSFYDKLCDFKYKIEEYKISILSFELPNNALQFLHNNPLTFPVL